MRIGYSFWGFLGDMKYDAYGNEASSPDGNATYSWSIVKRAIEAGHEIIPMMKLRDEMGFSIHGEKLFSAFSHENRLSAFLHLRNNKIAFSSHEKFPELDVLLLEWRFPIPGRNTPEAKMSEAFQPDLERQTELLMHYKDKKTKIIFWDLDHKLTKQDEELWLPNAVFETATKPLKLMDQRICVQPPICTDELVQFATQKNSEKRGLVYIGSRYERDDVIDQWISPIGNRVSIEFYGKWEGDCKQRWPNVQFHSRVTTNSFRDIYATAPFVPLLAKRSYFQNGFITPRPWEALMFGSMPIGLKGHYGVHDYVLNFAEDVDDLVEQTKEASMYSIEKKTRMRYALAQKLEFMDARNFIKQIESIA